MILIESRMVGDPTQSIRERPEPEADSDGQFRELFEHATDFIYIHDLEGRYTSINPAGLRLLGYTREESALLTTGDVLAPEYQGLGGRLLECPMDEARVAAYEVEFVAKDGRRIP